MYASFIYFTILFAVVLKLNTIYINHLGIFYYLYKYKNICNYNKMCISLPNYHLFCLFYLILLTTSGFF